MSANQDRKLSFIVFGGGDWWYHNRAHFDIQMARQFAKRGPVLYVNSIMMTKFNFGEGQMFFKRLLRKAKSILTGLKKVDKGFWIYSPFSMPVHHIPFARQINNLLLRFQLGCVKLILGIHKPVILVGIPSAVNIAIPMRKRGLIYQRTDCFEESIDVDADIIRNYDRTLKAKADVTVFVNKDLCTRESDQCKNPVYVDHGVDYELFSKAEQDKKVPEDMVNIPKPIIGYFGAIHGHSVDISLVEKIADLLPDMSFVYIGSDESSEIDLNGRKNIRLIGQKDYFEIPHYGKCFDVAILPWIQNKWTAASNPIKVKEYLALGKPFVCTPVFTEIEKYRDVSYIATTPEQFADCIKKALVENNTENILARQKKVEKETWDYKAQMLLSHLFK